MRKLRLKSGLSNLIKVVKVEVVFQEFKLYKDTMSDIWQFGERITDW